MGAGRWDIVNFWQMSRILRIGNALNVLPFFGLNFRSVLINHSGKNQSIWWDNHILDQFPCAPKHWHNSVRGYAPSLLCELSVVPNSVVQSNVALLYWFIQDFNVDSSASQIESVRTRNQQFLLDRLFQVYWVVFSRTTVGLLEFLACRFYTALTGFSYGFTIYRPVDFAQWCCSRAWSGMLLRLLPNEANSSVVSLWHRILLASHRWLLTSLFYMAITVIIWSVVTAFSPRL